MDDQEAGGIGGIGAAEVGRRVPRREVPPEEPAPRAVPLDRFEEEPPAPPMAAWLTSEEYREHVDAVAGSIAEVGALAADAQDTIQQLRGQVAQLEQDAQKDRQAIQNVFNAIEARLNGLAQRLVRNDLYLAAELAVRARQPGEPASSVTNNARALYEFITQKLEPTQGGEETAKSEAAPAGGTGPQVH